MGVLADRDEESGRTSNRQIALTKARDGVEGPIAAFTLEHIDLGVDEDGDPYGAAVVLPGDKPGQGVGSGRRRRSQAHKVFLDALDEMLIAQGKDVVIRAGMPVVRAVDLESVREEFYHRYVVADAGTPRAAQDARRSAFNRIIKQTIAGVCMAPYGERQMVWRI